MRKQYTKKQITEAIQYWESVLRRMDESKSILLDAFADEFGTDIVFGRTTFKVNDTKSEKMFSIFNSVLFENKLPVIPVKCMEYFKICETDSGIYNKYRQPEDELYVNPPETIYGMHSDIILNKIFKYDEPFRFAKEEVIYLNLSKLTDASFPLIAATLCHEMIHSYDRHFGEYQDIYKSHFIAGTKLRLHDTQTFKDKMTVANNNYVKVVKMIPFDQQVEKSNNDAVELALLALKESENGLSCTIKKNTPEVQLVGGGKFIMIRDFD